MEVTLPFLDAVASWWSWFLVGELVWSLSASRVYCAALLGFSLPSKKIPVRNSNEVMPPVPTRQHGVQGVYYAGDWVDIEDCDGLFTGVEASCSGCDFADVCPRSQTRNAAASKVDIYDVLVIGAGCIGAAVARELSKHQLSIVWLESADDVSQGATKGNSGIVHAGYDDKPGTNRAKYCWKGNQMFADLDRELRFGYQKNGSLVIAFSEEDKKHLKELKKRGETNGVKNLSILTKKELFAREPHVHPDAVGALYSPDAGNVIPYEYTIALAENAVDNGVELRIRREVQAIDFADNVFTVKVQHWEPKEYIDAVSSLSTLVAPILFGCTTAAISYFMLGAIGMFPLELKNYHIAIMALLSVASRVLPRMLGGKSPVTKNTPLKDLALQASLPEGKGKQHSVSVEEMLVGGSGSLAVMKGEVVAQEVVRARYVINCAGGASDQIARMIGDDSFKIKPRVGDYLLLNRNQGHLAKHTLFPCPHPVLGKGVLVQTTLWGNLILGPTARDMYQAEARDMSPASVQEYILSKCKNLVPSFDPKEIFHAFNGARAKSDRGDWIIEASAKNPHMLHVAGIDSPGLAGSPAIASEVVALLKKAGLGFTKDPSFNPNRAPIITPKQGMKGLKMGPVGKFESDGSNMEQMAANVICKCEKVTELEVVRAVRRSLPIDSSQAIRKRTRAGMGHCQGDPDNYACEARVRAIIAREQRVSVSHIGGRPWPATSTLSQRWIDEDEKNDLVDRMNHS